MATRDHLKRIVSALKDYIDDNTGKKLSTQQGSENTGKYMTVGIDGNISPTDLPIAKINNVEVTGDKTLADYNIPEKEYYYTKTDIDDKNFLQTETDPTVPQYVKDIQANDIYNWNNKSEFSGDYNDLENKPHIPSSLSELENDSKYITSFENTTYQIIKIDDYNYKLQSKELDGIWIDLTTINIPQYDDTSVNSNISNLKELVGSESVANQINNAIQALNLNRTYALITDVNKVNTKIGIVPEDKTIIELINDAESNATYDDSELRSKITTLQGEDTTKSARTIAAEEVVKIVAGADVSYDTLKEISDWIMSHKTDAASMNSAIVTLESLVGTTSVDSQIQEAINALSIGDYAKAADVLSLTSRVKATEDKLATVEDNSQKNIIEKVKVNNVVLQVEEDKSVNIDVPTGILASKDSISESDLDVPLSNKINAKANTSDIPTKTSDLENDSSFVNTDELNGKVDKNQGALNQGKVLGITEEGLVTPLELGHEGMTVRYDEETKQIYFEGEGSGSVNDYNEALNKPTINGVLVSGDKTLDDYGIMAASENLEKSIENFLAMRRTGKVYTVKFPLFETSNTSLGEKLDANAGLECNPSTDTVSGYSDYDNIGLFTTYDCNANVDENGKIHITSLKGMDTYKDTGKVDVFVLGMSYYEKYWTQDGYWYYSRTDLPREGYTPCVESIDINGNIMPYCLYGKYVVGDIDGLPYSSKGLAPARYISGGTNSKNISYNGCVDYMHKKGQYYCAGTLATYKYLTTSFYLKYANLNSQSIINGCFSYNLQYDASIIRDTEDTFFPLTKAQGANILVGSYVSVGYGKMTNDTTISKDRAYASVHAYADDVKVLRIEDIDDENVAVYLDIEQGFNTTPVTLSDTLTSNVFLTTMHWRSGFSDDVLGRDGCPGNLTNGKYPMVLQGVEMAVGGYEVAGNAIMDIVDETGKREVYITNNASSLTTNVTNIKSTYTKLPYAIQPTTLTVWNYITETEIDINNGAIIPTKAGGTGSGSTVGFCDGLYVDAASTGQREFLLLGYLWHGSIGGVSYLHANSALGSAGWTILARLSISVVKG